MAGVFFALFAPYDEPMTTASTDQLRLVVGSLPPAPRDTGQAPRPLEGAHVLLVHGFASTPMVNWHRTRWVSQLHTHGATVHTVTLPYHRHPESTAETPGAVSYELPATQELLRATADSLASYLGNLSGDVHLVGYSVGARICWTLASVYPDAVSSLIAGAMPLTNHLPLIGQALHNGGTLPDGFADIVAGSPVPEPQLQAFAALPAESFSPSPLPTCPVLFFRGDQDTVARDSIEAYKFLAPAQAVWLEYPRRDHINILTSGKLRAAAVEFMVRHRLTPASEVSQHTVA